MIRIALQTSYRRKLRRLAPIDPAGGRRDGPTVVVAPHPDDETLGCGGTILRKRGAGCAVTVVFITDGRSSHAHLMPPDRLAEIRKAEALAACRALRVPDRAVHFLGYPDGRLSDHQDEAAADLLDLFRTVRPAEVFYPHRLDPPADHRAANHIVRRAMAEWGGRADAFEYPVWAWHHWPFVRLAPTSGGGARAVVRNTIGTLSGVRLLRALNVAVDVRSVLDGKRAALAEHRSQMERQGADPDWPTLRDVAGGDLLACLLQPVEVFLWTPGRVLAEAPRLAAAAP
ncbi:PIG-L deacetylase family protein [Chthonobacter rhizosphaerae]|uniref:PIG-L deacetylase family protein n=1 Tax=Chthonobacter rhizosphaerae TaxID=2735553 RepID=UPI0015EEA286|nr:PIG-L family deacetylase [Chthonobacter rhizosphaerae]